MLLNEISDKYNRLEFESLIGNVSEKIDESEIRSVYHLKSIINSDNNIERVKGFIDDSKHFRISALKNKIPFSFHRVDSEGIVEAVESYFSLYLIVCKGSFYYVLIREQNFKEQDIEIGNQLHKIKSVEPFNYKLYFPKRRLVYNEK